MTSAAIHFPSMTDDFRKASDGYGWSGVVGAALSIALTLLLLVGTLLPPPHAGNGVPGAGVQSVPVRTARPIGSDGGERGSMAAVDPDDVQEDAAPPRIVGLASRIVLRPALLRTIDGGEATAGLRLDRPPRPVIAG